MNPYFFITMKDEANALAILERELGTLRNNRRLILADRDKALVLGLISLSGTLYDTLRRSLRIDKLERSTMQNDKLARLLQRFATTATAHFQALEEMNEEQANTCARMIAGLHRSIIDTGENGRQALLEMVDDNDPVVAGMAAVYSIRYDSKRSLSTLRRVALVPGLLGFRAQIAIERWESGEWRGPEE